jgi:hypothetical protein
MSQARKKDRSQVWPLQIDGFNLRIVIEKCLSTVTLCTMDVAPIEIAKNAGEGAAIGHGASIVGGGAFPAIQYGA